MDNRSFESGAGASAPTAPASPSSGYPQKGNPGTGTPATKPGPYWYHQMGEEVRSVIAAAGITPSNTDLTQLSKAIQTLIEARSGNYAIDTGVANAYVIALNPAVTAYTAGMTVMVKAINANTGASTLNAGAGVVALVNDSGAVLQTGDVPASSVFEAVYDATLNRFAITSLVPSQAISQAQGDARYMQLITGPVTVRQTVLSGPVDSNGYAAFGGSAGGTTVTAAGTLVATAANGTVNRTGTIVNPSWTGLSTNGKMYLGLTVNADGTCTPFSTTLALIDQFGGAFSITNGQRTFNRQQMQTQVGNGATAAQSYDLIIGEVLVAANVVSTITWYQLMARWEDVWTNTFPAAATSISRNHNLGFNPQEYGIEVKCLTAEGGFSVGDILAPYLGQTSYVAPFSPTKSPLTVQATTGAANAFVVNNKSTGVPVVLTAANWAYRLVAKDRGY